MTTLTVCYSTTLLQLQQLLGFKLCDIMTAFVWLGRNVKEIVVVFYVLCRCCVEGLTRTTQNISRDRTLANI
jgi:hypothetical protein